MNLNFFCHQPLLCKVYDSLSLWWSQPNIGSTSPCPKPPISEWLIESNTLSAIWLG
jgi:hypothetical protein